MSILRDAQFAIRTLTRSPGFTGVVILTLGLGIGASTAIFSIVNAVVLRPLDYAEPEKLVRITSELTGFGATDTGVAAAELIDYQSLTDVFSSVAGILPISANVTSENAPERVEMMLVSWTYFQVLGVPPALGRTFGANDDTPGVANIAVVSDGFWRRRLGGDPHAVGRTVVIDQDPILIVGVMPQGFGHPGRAAQNDVDVWSPAGFRTTGGPPIRSRRRLDAALARLQPGVTIEQAQTRLAEYGAMLSRQFPSDYPAQNGWRPRLSPLQETVVSGIATPMFVLLTSVGLLLLVACVNVAHLILARSSARRQEMAIRRALGASGGRLTWQLATESALLAIAGGALALLVASWGLDALLALAPARVPRLEDVRIDFTAIAVTGLISVLVTLVFAFGPALRVRRDEGFSTLKDAGAGRTTDHRAGRSRSVLVAVEVAMATVLLLGAGLLVRTVVGLLNVPLGFDSERLLTARITLPRPNDASRAAYLDPARRAAFYRETLQRIQALPGVEKAAVSTQIPMGGFNPPIFVEIDKRTAEDPGVRPVIHNFQVSPSYFETMGIRILRGRGLLDTDRAGAELAAVISETAARTFWKDRDPIGERLRLSPELPWMTVVGIAADVRSRRLTEPPPPILYRSVEQSSDLSLALLIRTRADATALGEHVAREVRAVDPGIPIYSVRTMSELLDAAVSQRLFLMRLLVAFGTVATLLALLGAYGVMSYSVSQRRREIGIRMAFGARHVDVMRMIMLQGMTVTSAGMLSGIVAALALVKLVRSQLYDVKPSDPLTIAAVLLLMISVAGIAAYLPARRAARVDPMNALRSL